MNITEDIFKLPTLFESININFAEVGGGSNIANGTKHTKTLPWAVFAQSVKGQYEISIDNGQTVKTEPGGAFLVKANHNLEIIHCAQNDKMEINWLHIQSLLFDSIDLLSLYKLPLILTPAEANPIGKTVNAIRKLDKKTTISPILSHLQKKSLSYNALCSICSIGKLNKINNKDMIERLIPAIRVMNENLHKPLKISSLATIVNLSKPYFHSIFKNTFGVSPHHYFMELRIKKAKMSLLVTEQNISEIGYSIGFDDPYHFSRVFKKIAGISPKLYRDQKKYLTP